MSELDFLQPRDGLSRASRHCYVHLRRHTDKYVHMPAIAIVFEEPPDRRVDRRTYEGVTVRREEMDVIRILPGGINVSLSLSISFTPLAPHPSDRR